MSAGVAPRLAAVRGRIDAAARAAGRSASDVTLVVVTKEVDLDLTRAVVQAGARDLGENRAQELVPKARALAAEPEAPRWHFIGRLQRNKVRALAPWVVLWQSVDSAELAEEIARRAAGASVLVQVNFAREPQKGGCDPADVPALIARCGRLGLVVEGLMTVPPIAGDPRPWFRACRRTVDEHGLRTCSMGMSGDFEIAVEEGATLVRVGTAVVGPRPSAPGARR